MQLIFVVFIFKFWFMNDVLSTLSHAENDFSDLVCFYICCPMELYVVSALETVELGRESVPFWFNFSICCLT